MKQIILAVRMLKKDWKSNVYYTVMLAIVSATAFIFGGIPQNVYLQVAMDTNLYGKLIPRYSEFIIMIVVGFSLFLAFHAYLYALKRKSQELKLIKAAGGSLIKMTVFLSIQNIICILLGSIGGLLIGLIIQTLIHFIIYTYLNIQAPYFMIDITSMIDSFLIHIFSFVITTILGCGYIHRNEIQNLSDQRTDWTKDKRIVRFPSFIHIFLYVLGIIMFLTAEDETLLMGAIAYSLIGCCGASGLIRQKVCEILRQSIYKKERMDKIQNIVFHSLIYTLKQNFLLVLGLLFSSTAMMSWTISCVNQPKEFIVAFLSFICSLILLYSSAFSIFLTECKKRESDYELLWKCGFSFHDILIMVRKEIVMFYSIIFGFSIVYIILMLVRFILLDSTHFVVAIGLLLSYLVILMSMLILTILCVCRDMKRYQRG